MIREQILQNLNTLPPDAQREVLDFIVFLKTRYEQKEQSITNLDKSPFVGMWEDREDIKDSSAWVRSVRTQEWE